MRILALYIGRFTHNSAATIFIPLAVFISVSGIIKFVEQGKGN
ncbi:MULTISPECIES: hypothetical protein [Colwellia]|uniref:Uncharacterized protein n=1 Tax=Colwellia marinimaniae TaxID=1513592 RepID=A0ABQ0MWC6_9GAMM|nr:MULTISPECIES: hypothetical protein [Colwellia]GAW96662.1 hypothetical protein MTCD1_02281 [Colwellia marinimaniae]